MKKNKKYYMSLRYPIQIEEVDEGFCAFISELKGCKAFGETAEIALKELELVKEGFIDVFLEMGKPIPEPVVHLDIPYGIFRKMKHREDLEVFVVS
jgi:predicted RNase H-like HicB family nuclease